MPYYGTKSRPMFGHNISSGYDNLRGTLFGSLPEDAHIYSMGFYAGYYTAGDPATAKGAIYTQARALVQATNAVALNDRFIENNDGVEIDNIALPETIIAKAGERYILAILGYDGAFSHGQDSTTAFMYRSDRSGSTLPSTIPSSGDTQTRITIWANYEANVAPQKPSNITPADGSTTTSLYPTYEGDFRDDNELMPNGLSSDWLTAYQIQVRSVSAENATTGTLVWDSGWITASSTERTNRRFSRVHGGSALVAGQRYQMRCRVQDRHGWSSEWSHGQTVAEAWQDFLVTGAGIVTLDGLPYGRTTDSTPDFQGRYHNVVGTAATHVKIQLWSGNTFIKETTDIAKSISSSAMPGTLFTITAAEAQMPTLTEGVEYQYRIAAKSSGVWSDWSAFRTFKMNSRPTAPANLRPSGAVVTTYPLLTAMVTDPDGDTMTAVVDIFRRGNSSLNQYTATYDATLYGGVGGFKYQTNASSVPAYDTYDYTFMANDGDLDSPSRSDFFTYAQGPTVTITSPTQDQVITTDTPTIQWTVSNQVKRRVYIYKASDNSLVHDSGEATTASTSYTVPANLLRNNTAYYVVVQVTDNVPLTGTSSQRNFSLVYTTPAAVTGFSAAPDYAEQDVEASVIRLSWDAINVATGDYLRTSIYRGDVGAGFADADKIYETSNQGMTTWVDTTPRSGVSQTYWIAYEVQESALDILTSETAEASSMIDIQATVISDIRAGMTDRVYLWSTQERTEETRRDQTEVQTWDGGEPWLFEGPVDYTTITVEAYVYATSGATVEEQLNGLRQLAGKRTDGSRVLSCYRDERGRKLFGRVRNVRIRDVAHRRARVQFSFTQLRYTEAL